MKKFVLILALLCGCGASLPEITHDADQGALKLNAAIAVLRSEVKPYAQLAVSMCGSEVPLDKESCAGLDLAAQKLSDALETAQAALNLYIAGESDFEAAYGAVSDALELAESYAQKVMALREHSRT